MPSSPRLINRRQAAVGLALLPVLGGASQGCTATVDRHAIESFAAIAETATGGAAMIAIRGWRVPGIGAARYRRVAAPPPAGSPWAARAAAVSRDGHAYVLDPGDTIEVDQFGAIGDDETDDRAAIAAAIAFWQETGKTLGFSAGRHYFVGSFAERDNRVFMIDHLRDAVIDGRGATLRSHSAATPCQTYMFTFRDFRNLTIRALRGTDRGTDINAEWRGLYFISPDANLGDCEGLVIDDVIVSDAVVLLFAAGTLPQRIRDIRITNATAVRCYYGMVFAENGDRVRAALTTRNCRRSYFAYGVTDHAVTLTVEHDDTARGADTCCLVKRYVFDTSGIALAATFHGSVSRFHTLVKLEHQPKGGTTGLIADIAIDLNLRGVTTGLDQVVAVGFASYAGPQAETGTTRNRWSDIRIMGDIARAGVPIAASAIPSTPASIYLDGAAATAAAALPAGFVLHRNGRDAARSQEPSR